jgi:pyridine nucleotide-disulfide oxidoreductase
VERVPVAVVGAGQAGLATSSELRRHGVEHVVLERGRVGETWRERWDSFCLVTPNWSVQLPRGHYAGTDPDGFMLRDEIVGFLEKYAAGFEAPVREGVAVHSVERGFVLHTSAGDMAADSVVAATGAYQRPHRPAVAATLPPDVLQLDVDDFRNDQALPPGRVLIVGSGQSGCQLGEELHEAGREVVLSCGRAPWLPRRFGGHDLVWWLVETGFLDAGVETLPSAEARLFANVLATGHEGGHDLHLRTLRALGVTLVGHFVGVEDGHAHFAPDLGESVAWGDERYGQLRELCRKLGVDPGLEDPEPFDASSPERVDLTGFGAAIFAGGFRPDYRSWLPWPEAFDDMGFPLQRDGASTVVPGLYFVGVHFLRKRKSSLLVGVGEDATIVAEQIAESASA